MPQRVVNFWLALAGLAALAAVLLVGLDARRLARTGPAWRRRLLSAGLALMAALGLTGCDTQAGRAVAPTAEVLPWSDSDDLAAHPRWRGLMAAWHEAGEIARGRGMLYPIDQAGKDRLLRRLGPVVGDIDYLEQKGLLTKPEAGLLRADLADLTAAVKLLPTTDGPKWESTYVSDEELLDAAEKAATRLAGSETLHRAVLRLLRPDVDRIANDIGRHSDNPEMIRAKRLLEKLDAMSRSADEGKSLAEAPAWRQFERAWIVALAVLRSAPADPDFPKWGDPDPRFPYDATDLTAAAEGLTRATGSIEALARTGVLGSIEADVLRAQSERLMRALWWESDARHGYFAHYARLAKRLPLVRALADAPLVHAEPLETILIGLQGDLALCDEEEDLRATTQPAPTAEQVQAEGGFFQLRRAEAKAEAERRRTRWQQARDRAELRDIVRRLTERLPAARGDLTRDHRWGFVERAWCEGMLIGRQWYGVSPCSEYGHRRALGELSVAIGYVSDLREAGVLTETEADLLALDLTELREVVRCLAPSMPELPMCYENGPPLYPHQAKAPYFRSRLELLRKLAAQDKLNPRVVGKLLTTMELNWSNDREWAADLYGRRFPDEAAKELEIGVGKVRDQIIARLKTADARLTDSPHWQTIQLAWRRAVPLAQSGRSTTAARNAADESLKQAWQAAQQLTAEGLLFPAEAQILQNEALYLRENLFRSPPADARGRNYKAPWDWGWGASWRVSMLANRIPDGVRFEDDGALRPVVLDLVRQSVHADLAGVKDAWGNLIDEWQREGGKPAPTEPDTSGTGTGGLFGEKLFDDQEDRADEDAPESDSESSPQSEMRNQEKKESP